MSIKGDITKQCANSWVHARTNASPNFYLCTQLLLCGRCTRACSFFSVPVHPILLVEHARCPVVLIVQSGSSILSEIISSDSESESDLESESESELLESGSNSESDM